MPAFSVAQKDAQESIQKRSFGEIARKIRLAKKDVVTAAVFFFCTLSQWFYLPSPFALCCLIAMGKYTKKPFSAWGGMLLGCVYQTFWRVQAPWWNLIAAAIVPLLGSVKWRKGWHMPLVAGVLILPGQMIYGFTSQYTAQDWMLTALMTFAAVAAMPALSRAAAWLHDAQAGTMHADDVLCLMLPLMMLFSGMSKTSVWIINLGYAAAVCFTLVNAHVLSAAPAMSISFLTGASFLLGGQGSYWCVVLGLSGLMCGMFQGKRRGILSCLHLLVAITVGYLYTGKMLTVPLASSVFGSILALCVPARYLHKYTQLIQDTSVFKKADNPYLERCMKQLISSVRSLSAAVPAPSMAVREPSEVSEEMMERLCEHCDRMLICWRDEQDVRKAQFISMAEELLAKGSVQTLPTECTHPDRMMSVVRHLCEKENARLRRVQQVCYEQDMLRTHFEALAQSISARIQEGTEPSDGSAYLEKQIDEMLNIMKYPAHVRYIKQCRGHYSVALQCDPFSIVPSQDGKLEKCISQRLGRTMRMCEKQEGLLLFEETPLLHIVSGLASACAVSAERKNITPYAVENGDAVVRRSLRDGVEMVALSDGMGHGIGASAESKKTLELISCCLDAGYERGQAISAVNGMMLSATGGERFATVDLCLIDQWTGEVCLNKLGACISLIVQGQHIRVVEGAALPLGIIEHIVPMEHRMRLGHGDMVLLLSDGITDAFSDENALSTLIQRYLHCTPQTIADSLLQDALIQSGGLPRDDMTVVCIKIFEREGRFHRI